jgi:hypothetical protein
LQYGQQPAFRQGLLPSPLPPAVVLHLNLPLSVPPAAVLHLNLPVLKQPSLP